MDFKAHLEHKLRELLNVESVDLAIPPEQSMGDFALACFPFAKTQGKTPQELAAYIASELKDDAIDRIETKGPYLNIFIKKDAFVRAVLEAAQDPEFAKGAKSEEKWMIEFSQANTNKAFHVGHIRGTSLGESLARILSYDGKQVIRANYQGDTGMHVAKWIWCYTKFHKDEEPREDEAWIASIYVDAIARLKDNEQGDGEVREINRKLDARDPEYEELRKKTRKLSLDAFEKIYTELNTHFDEYFFEGEMEEDAKSVSKELVNKGIAKISDGATIMDLEDVKKGVWVLLRDDGTALYSAKDIALAKKKFEEFKIDHSVYVVGKEQELHFMQLFETLRRMGFKQAHQCRYVPVSLVKLPHGKMSSRTGDNILYSAFKDEMIEQAKTEIAKRFELDESELYRRSLAVAIAAIKYSMLKQHPNKEIVFVKEEAMQFVGDTGPYLLYAYARASSILKKAGSSGAIGVHEFHPKEIALIKEIERFPEKVQAAASKLSPALIANYAYSLASTFSEFYTACPVIGEQEQEMRLYLVDTFRKVLKQSLDLLGIDVLEEM